MVQSLGVSYANYTAAQCFTLPPAQQVACSQQQLNVTMPPRWGEVVAIVLPHCSPRNDNLLRTPAWSCSLRGMLACRR